MKISKDMIIVDVLRKYPKVVEVFEKFNMGCVSCLGVQNESIEKGCMMHGINPDELINELEKFINENY
ncbi:conserved hypothetical protein [Deferribacter desulfuricans SSM1]|uniref:DUF1858 domain-containing protein n=1 Tax=Deferribacter desulfuricans (strain DSM 14783 / JCM 11476 / NBRC 101012 / SSM1) TaxID=639282 RepID=D3PCF8_DEFDS|nr:DUF1858 domain-containing protein [Deferribacter desulfuricans]BAI80281.1 conserved hypothetical protein [Deferribacter desulfuricans SSM1]